MAHITQVEKRVIADALKVALKEFPSVKISLAIKYSMKIVCTIKQGPKSLAPKNGDTQYVNKYTIDKNYVPEAAKILNVIVACLHIGHYDNSDTQTDYFDCAWYVEILIGNWNKPFVAV